MNMLVLSRISRTKSSNNALVNQIHFIEPPRQREPFSYIRYILNLGIGQDEIRVVRKRTLSCHYML
jgi:hypothetical protein